MVTIAGLRYRKTNFLNFFFSSISHTPHHRASFRYNSSKKRASYIKLQGRRPSRTYDRVVQRWGARAYFAYRQQIASSPSALGIALLPQDSQQQEGTRRWRVLVRGQEHSRIGAQQERDASGCRWVEFWNYRLWQVTPFINDLDRLARFVNYYKNDVFGKVPIYQALCRKCQDKSTDFSF